MKLSKVTIRGFELKIGDRIHIKKFKGTYWITALTELTMIITCNKWLKCNTGAWRQCTLPLEEFENYEYGTKNLVYSQELLDKVLDDILNPEPETVDVEYQAVEVVHLLEQSNK